MEPHKKCSVHYHKLKKETFYVIKGSLTVEYSSHIDKDRWNSSIDIQYAVLQEGDALTIDRNTPHRFYTTDISPCDFIEISTHHDESDSYRIIDSI